MPHYLQALIFASAGIAAALAVLAAGRWAPPVQRTEPALRPFESGAEPQVHAWNRHHVRFFNFTLIFILFDMEMVFMYPWAVVFFQTGWKAFMEMGMFIAILVLGILYAWREGAFEWD